MAENDSIAIPRRVKDLTGRDDFGRLTVLAYAGLNNRREAIWHCQCNCGTISIVESASLLSGKSKSCGCLRKESIAQRSTTHGLSGIPEYGSWTDMRKRCYNPAHQRFHRQGGSNIRVCERWQSLEAFCEDMGTKPTPEHSVERRNNNGNYSCGKCSECIANNWESNCYWATDEQQARNRSSNRFLTHNGQTMCMADWAVHLGIDQHTLAARLRKGWSPERALTQPVEFREKQLLTFNGETKCIADWGVQTGINRKKISGR